MYLGFRPTVHLSGASPESLSRAVNLWIFLSVSRKVTVNALEDIQIGNYCYVSVHTGMCDNALLPQCVWCVGHWCVGPGDLEIDLARMVLGPENAKIWKNTQENHRGCNSEGQWKIPVYLLVPVPHQMAHNALHCPSGNTWSGQSWYSFYRWLPAVQHPRLANWLMFEIYGLTASFVQFHGLEERVSRTPHVLPWPLGAQSWLYILLCFFMPWKIFTQVSHNHSGTAVDTERRADGHTPAVGYIIFLQRCSGDTSVSSLAHQLIKFGWMKTAWLCSMKGLGIISIKTRTLSFNFHKIPKITAYQMDLNLCRVFRCVLGMLCMCYEPCESFHALYKAVGQRLFPPHTQRSNTDLWLLRLPATSAGSSPT